jgi:hypothetical protein
MATRIFVNLPNDTELQPMPLLWQGTASLNGSAATSKARPPEQPFQT